MFVANYSVCRISSGALDVCISSSLTWTIALIAMGKVTSSPPALGGHVSGQSNQPLSRPPHSLSPSDVLHELHADQLSGLSSAEASRRLTELGPNELNQQKGVQPIKIFFEQIFNAMTLVS